jgi:hypothetical protein
VYSFGNEKVTSNVFIGEENYSERYFHNLILSTTRFTDLEISASFDIGHQTSVGSWAGGAVIAAHQMTQHTRLNGRIETYQDQDAAITSDSLGRGLRASSISCGVDTKIAEHITLRTEIRSFWSPNRSFTIGTRQESNDVLVMTNLSFDYEQLL